MSGKAHQRDRLPREVLKWIQSLDLAYSVKNVRRDFANGFLVAEIFSRYDERNVQMHSFDNGSSLAARKDNWALMSRYFRKRGFETDQDEVDSIIHCEPGAAVAFINRAYTFLTNRRIPEPPQRVQEEVPPFMKPTATSLLANQMRTAELAEQKDEVTAEHKLRETLDRHEQALQGDKSADPARYTTKGRRRLIRGEPHTPGAAAAEVPRVQVRNVRVRQLNQTAAELRMSRDLTASGAEGEEAGGVEAGQQHSSWAADTASQGEFGSGHVAGSVGASGRGGGASRPPPVTDALDRMCRDASPDTGAPPSFDAFTRAAEGGELSDEAVGRVMQELAAVAPEVAESCLDGPGAAHALTSPLGRLLAAAGTQGAAFSGAALVLGEVGRACSALSAARALALAVDFVLPPLIPALRGGSQDRRRAAVQSLLAFAPEEPSARARLLRGVKEALGTCQAALRAFVDCMAESVHLEPQLPDHLLDLYCYYAVIGMAQPAPTTRASALGIAAVLARRALDADAGTAEAGAAALVADMLPTVEALATDAWWAVRAQVLAVAVAVLRAHDAGRVVPARGEGKEEEEEEEGGGGAEGDDVEASCRRLIRAAARDGWERAPTAVRYACAATLTQVAGAREDLGDEGVQCLLALPSAARALALGADDAVMDEAVAAAVQQLGLASARVAEVWDGPGIAVALSRRMAEEGAQYVDAAQVQVLAAVAREAHAPFAGSRGAEVGDALLAVMDYVFLALCDPDCCAEAAAVLERFLLESGREEEVLAAPARSGVLRLLFPAGDSAEEEEGADPACQDALAQTVRAVAAEGGRPLAAVRSWLLKFDQGSPGSRRQHAVLDELLEEVQGGQ